VFKVISLKTINISKRTSTFTKKMPNFMQAWEERSKSSKNSQSKKSSKSRRSRGSSKRSKGRVLPPRIEESDSQTDDIWTDSYDGWDQEGGGSLFDDSDYERESSKSSKSSSQQSLSSMDSLRSGLYDAVKKSKFSHLMFIIFGYICGMLFGGWGYYFWNENQHKK
jgi:hypothetical protein